MWNVRVTRSLRLVGLVASMAFWAVVSRATLLPLQGRTIDGRAVASDAPEAVFEYDPNLDLTWLRDWNYSRTSGYDSDGRMNWYDAMDWAAQLKVGRFDGWSLPQTVWPDPTCVAQLPLDDPNFRNWSDCKGGPLNFLWFEELGNEPLSVANPGPFVNVQRFLYWSQTKGEAPGTAWYWSQGWQGWVQAYDVASPFAVAVRAGDVLPEPRSLALTLLALVAAAAATRRRCVTAARPLAPAAVRVRAHCR